ncbi:hypothetical protein G6O69_29310 [Pseudenhygromyxa sp. WMMC2535]|uniref:hypothetical protein n=1 Tax=Pseudenhygromyxa sp. WMMC2535 TaxID=2712867 RepID=UPI0015574A9F|nr:hypothetical protein [Pseudenhygromyxa sp. WMMC2535]NVB41962.1 hypothetical protein [Pseudenhygromyxa sp. WMMC2535]
MNETPKVQHETDATSALIDDLAGGGEFVDEGRFRLDLARAREKLHDYRLSEPEIYTCLLVEVAVLVGAERIDFALERGKLEARFSGAGFDATELEHLSEALFIDLAADADEAEQRRWRALQMLSIAIQAVSGLGAHTIELRSPPAERALKIDIDEDGEERWALDTHEVTSRLNCVRVGFPWRTRAAELPGVEQLRRRCEWSKFPIYIGDERISRGHAAAFLDINEKSVVIASHRPITTESGEEIGQGTIIRVTTYDSALVHVLCNGWYVERLTVPTTIVGFEAVVELDLRRDIAQASFLRDEAFEAMCAAVTRCARELESLDRAGERFNPQTHVEPSSNGCGILILILWTLGACIITFFAYLDQATFFVIFGLIFVVIGVFATRAMIKHDQTPKAPGLPRHQYHEVFGRPSP